MQLGMRQDVSDSEALLRSPLALPKASADRGVRAVELAKLIVYYTTLGNISLKADVI
jgi:hypothetical protein